MTSITPNLAASAMGRADARDAAAEPAADSGPFVLNLCSSTTPMALAQTDLAELKRFTFFVSRRFEEGRERFFGQVEPERVNDFETPFVMRLASGFD